MRYDPAVVAALIAAVSEHYDFDDFVDGYIEVALFSSNDESRDDGGDPLDRNYGPEDIADEAMLAMRGECAWFLGMHGDIIRNADHKPGSGGDTVWNHAGRDFWYTRNGHGCGFWDGDWPEPTATTLDKSAHAFRGVDLYVGDDKRIHA